MKEFLRSTLAALTGIIIAGFILLPAGIGLLVGLLSRTDANVSVAPNSVFVLDLKGNVIERYESSPLDDLLGEEVATYGLDDILQSIGKAKENNLVKGIYLNAGAYACSPASLKEIRDALTDFKKSGKFVVAYGGNYTQGTYYLASVADKVIVNPSGNIVWQGLSAQPIFFKDLLKKAGIKMQVFRVGNYKAAVEPFTETGMSEANREQVQAYLQSIWGNFLTDISQSRNLSTDSLNKLADRNMTLRESEAYVETGLADTLMYKDEVLDYLKKLSGCKPEDKLRTLTLSEMIQVKPAEKSEKSDAAVAVYYAYGDIDGGTNPNGEGISSGKVIKDLRKLREDKKIKAVVLRINSPGGSAYGSEQIWREVSLLKEKKPVVVSMGDYAASGGYYMACAANKIVASPTTLTGSIGIFSLIPDASELLTDKLELHTDVVKTNRLADFGRIDRPFNEDEKMLIQERTNQGYELFTRRCSEGRNIPIEELKKIAEGRVWTGEMALKLNLVDELGGLDEAIDLAARLAELEDYRTVAYPEKENGFLSLFQTGADRYIESRLGNTFGGYYRLLLHFKDLKQSDYLQARMPFDLYIR